jgi:hypothetical protein
MYILTCKGNVYQSCGDDEQSLLHYMEGWAKAKALASDKTKVVAPNGTSSEEWEMVAVNAIGMLAYHNVRYEVAALCFNVVAEFREKVCLSILLQHFVILSFGLPHDIYILNTLISF